MRSVSGPEGDPSGGLSGVSLAARVEVASGLGDGNVALADGVAEGAPNGSLLQAVIPTIKLDQVTFGVEKVEHPAVQPARGVGVDDFNAQRLEPLPFRLKVGEGGSGRVPEVLGALGFPFEEALGLACERTALHIRGGEGLRSPMEGF